MTDKLCKLSLFCTVLAFFTENTPAAVSNTARAHKTNTYANAYNQVVAMQQQQEYFNAQNAQIIQPASATATMPVEVEDKQLKEAIKNNSSKSVTMTDLEQCSMIYPNGEFKWGVPQSGENRTIDQQCMAVVSLIDAKPPYKVLATTTLGAGDIMKCNIDMFPQSGYTAELRDYVLPADEAPTEKDVEKALNKEQKQNAGFKIAAAAIIGGLAGNMLTPKDSDDDKLLGTSKTQLLDTALGAAAASSVMAASSYSGKVAGDTIKSTAINATAGMVVANMAAGMSGSDSVLATTKCKINNVEYDCVIGRYYAKSGSIADNTNYNGKTIFYATETGSQIVGCDGDRKNCATIAKQFLNIKLIKKDSSSTTDLDDIKSQDFTNYESAYISSKSELSNTPETENQTLYYRVSSADITENSVAAYAKCSSLPSKPLGYKVSDWDDDVNKRCTSFYRRYGTEVDAGDALSGEGSEFKPSARNAQDGSIIDLGNEARAKATMLGAAAGGALGGFTGYQGAQAEIADRWQTAQYEYTNSLQNFACYTGKRFLNFYNGFIQIPPMQSQVEQTQEQDQQQ